MLIALSECEEVGLGFSATKEPEEADRTRRPPNDILDAVRGHPAGDDGRLQATSRKFNCWSMASPRIGSATSPATT